jgi:AhpD family alkylhydroperoxidase
MSLADVAPAGYRAVVELNNYVSASVDGRTLALVKLRASIVNGCAYCTDMHSAHALRQGEPARHLFAVAAWRDAPFFTPRERSALALTDALTSLAPSGQDPGGVPDDVWATARGHWSERKVADLVLAIGTINLWNRIAVSTQMELPGA